MMRIMHTRGMKMSRIAAAALLALAVGTAHAADYYVDVSWTGTPSGTANAPFKTIKAAVDAANAVAATHNIYIAAGWYGDTANGGTEDYSAGGGTAGGIYISRLSINIYGGYSGWDGDGADPGDFDWTEAARVPRATIIDLKDAGSRAFYHEPPKGSGSLFDGLTFQNASHGANGGALYSPHIVGGRNLFINNCLFTNNVVSSGAWGGAVWVASREGQSWVRHSDFVANGAAYGGALSANNTYANSIPIENCTFLGNHATARGGAIYFVANGAGTYIQIIRECHFEANTAGLLGGAIMSEDAGVRVERSVFTQNAAPSGAALGGVTGSSSWGCSYFLENCLIYRNTGGYAVEQDGPKLTDYSVDILHCTIVENPGGGVKFRDRLSPRPARIRNSIIAFNGNYGVYRVDNDDATIFSHNNVFGNTNNYFNCVADADSISADPGFADAGAGDYGLAKGSFCIDAGTDAGVTVDLVGFGRPARNGFDMGAYEEWQLPAIWYQYAMAQVTEVTPRVVLSHQPDGYPTDAWIALDTSDKGTDDIEDWGQRVKFDAPAAGVVLYHTFTGLTAETDYVYRVWVSNAYDNAWGELGEVRTLAAGAPVQLLWFPTSANQRWSTTASETNWTANAGMTLTPWVQGASAVFDGLPSTTPNAWGGVMEFNSIKLTGVTSGALTIGRVSSNDADRLGAVEDALVEAPAGTSISLPQVSGGVGLTVTGGGLVSSSRGFVFSGGIRVLDGTFQGLPSDTNGDVDLLDGSGSANARLYIRSVNNNWTMSTPIIVRGGSDGVATLENSPTVTSSAGYFPTVASDLVITNTLIVTTSSRASVYTLTGNVAGPGDLELRATLNNEGFILEGDSTQHTGILILSNPNNVNPVIGRLNGIQGHSRITIGANYTIDGSGTLICNVTDGVADKITLGNNALIDLSGLTLAPNDPERTPGEYPIITPKSRVTGKFAAVVGKFNVAYDGTDAYPDDVVLVVPPPSGTLLLIR